MHLSSDIKNINSYSTALLESVENVNECLDFLKNFYYNNIANDINNTKYNKFNLINLKKDFSQQFLNQNTNYYLNKNNQNNDLNIYINFLMLLIQRKNLTLFLYIVINLESLYYKTIHQKHVVIVSAGDLSDIEKKILENKIIKLFPNNKLHYEYLKDCNLLSGFIIKIDSYIIDHFFNRQFLEMKKNIILSIL